MAVIISGKLIGPNGDPRPGVTIMLTATRTSSAVVKLAPSMSMTGNDGSYSMAVEVGTHSVMIEAYGRPFEKVGQITVYADSAPGTLNDFLTMPGESDLTPEIIAIVEEMRNAAANSAKNAKDSEEAAKRYSESAENIADANTYYITEEDPDGTIAGIAGTPNGKSFRVGQGIGELISFIYYVNVNGVAVPIASENGNGVIKLIRDNREAIESAFESIAASVPGGVIDGDNVPLAWDDSEDPKVITALRNGVLEVFSGISFDTAAKVDDALGRDPHVSELIGKNNATPVIWDSSTDPKVLMSMLDDELNIYPNISFGSAIKVDDVLGRETRIDAVFNPETDTALLWDASDDPKVIMFADKDGKIQAPMGFGAAGGTAPVSFETTVNSYVSQNVRALLHSVKSGKLPNRNVKVLLTGHSWTDFLEIPKAYRDMLQPVYGDGGIGYQSFNPTRVPDGMTCVSSGFTKRTIFDAVTADGTGINGRSLYATSEGATVKFDGLSGEQAVIHYQDLAGSFSVKVGDAEPVQVAGGGTNKYKTLTVTVPSSPTAVEVTTTSAGKVNLFGVAMENASGVSVFGIGNAGCNAHDYVNHCIKNYPDVVPVVNPDVVLILLGTNEVINKVPPTVYRSYLTNLVRAWKNNVKPGVGINIVSCAHTLNTSNSAQQVLYPPVERGVALAEGVGYVDGFDIFPRPPVSGDARLFANTEHLNENGATYFVDRVVNKLLEI